MLIKDFEERVSPNLKWGKIENIPDFPLKDFEEVRHAIDANKFALGIDYTVSNQLAQWLFGQGHKFIFLILASTPFIVAILSLILAVLFSNYWLLVGIVLGFLGQLLANPYNPTKDFWKSLVGLLFLVFLYGLWQGEDAITYLSAFFVFPFFINSYLYSMNQRKLEIVALNSEKIFIYLFQIGKLGLRDNTTGHSYWHREK